MLVHTERASIKARASSRNGMYWLKFFIVSWITGFACAPGGALDEKPIDEFENVPYNDTAFVEDVVYGYFNHAAGVYGVCITGLAGL